MGISSNDANGIANSEDPDLGLHCLPRPICPKAKGHCGKTFLPTSFQPVLTLTNIVDPDQSPQDIVLINTPLNYYFHDLSFYGLRLHRFKFDGLGKGRIRGDHFFSFISELAQL